MTVFFHELKRNKLSVVIWTAAIAFMLAISILLYPEMSTQMNEMNDMFSNMGSFSDAFGMDSLNFGEFLGYFAVECGNVLGMGGAFFAAIVGASALSKEERDKTAEFLLTHPISRCRIVTEKIFSVVAQIFLLNIGVISVALISIFAIRESLPFQTAFWLFFSYFLMQIEIAAITFGISALIRKGAVALGIGIAAIFYFMNILSNLSDKVTFLKFITPFGYADSADIVNNNCITLKYLIIGILFSIASIGYAFYQYQKKDIH